MDIKKRIKLTFRMNRYLIVSGIVVLLICIGLSGCTDTGRNVNVEIIDYKIESMNEVNGGYYKIDDGFNFSEKVDTFLVSGNLTNKEGRLLDEITVIANFYDKNDNFIQYARDKLYDLPNSYTSKFEVYLEVWDTYYFNDIAKVSLYVKNGNYYPD